MYKLKTCGNDDQVLSTFRIIIVTTMLPHSQLMCYVWLGCLYRATYFFQNCTIFPGKEQTLNLSKDFAPFCNYHFQCQLWVSFLFVLSTQLMNLVHFYFPPLKKLFNPINITNTLTKMTTLPCGIVIDPKLFQYCSSARLKLNLKLNFLSLASVEKKFFFLETAASRCWLLFLHLESHASCRLARN